MSPMSRMSRTLLALALAVTACGDDPAGRATIATYNLGLATGFVDYAAQRRPALVDLVKSLDVEVLCLQEVWTAADVSAVTEGARSAFPHSYHVMLEDTTLGPPACTTAETDPLAACVATSCPDVPASEIATCALEHCRTEFAALSSDCTGCVVANIGKEVAEIIATCRTGSLRYAYNGANGLVLLSKLPLLSQTHEKLSSTNVQRSVLAAKVDHPHLGRTAVVCTHLASDLTSAGVPYAGPHGSWSGENKAQAEAALAFMSTFAGDARVKVLLGDMNSGPAFGDTVSAEIPEASYQVILDAGYIDFPSTSRSPAASACTYCADNTLVKSGEKSVQIDRIAVSPIPAGFKDTVDLIGTATIQITVNDQPVTTHPSDHFGVRLVLER